MTDIEKIRQFLLEYNAHNTENASSDRVDQFLREYVSLKRQKDALQRLHDELNFSYKEAEQYAELRGRKDDPKVATIEKKIVGISDKLQNLISQIADHCDIAIDMISLVDNTLTREVLIQHYINGMLLKEVEGEIHFCRTTTIALHKNGLNAIREKLGFPTK